jgi:hypothetical protein
MLLDNDKIKIIRNAVYYSPGFYVFKNFLTSENTTLIKKNWTGELAYEFDSFIKNIDVKINTPKYCYHKPTPQDFAYCTHIWNQPIDERLHEQSYKIQMMRNQVEGKPLYFALHQSTGKALQYRVCRTVSNLNVVKRHTDFFEEYRADPTGEHKFDPSRIQATLFLSDYGIDYKEGGFKLWDENKKSYILFGKDIPVSAGDLVFWRYSLPHEVSGVEMITPDFSFLRVIYPLFDIKQ